MFDLIFAIFTLVNKCVTAAVFGAVLAMWYNIARDSIIAHKNNKMKGQTK